MLDFLFTFREINFFNQISKTYSFVIFDSTIRFYGCLCDFLINFWLIKDEYLIAQSIYLLPNSEYIIYSGEVLFTYFAFIVFPVSTVCLVSALAKSAFLYITNKSS